MPRKKTRTSTKAMSLNHAREELGWKWVEDVEKWNPYAARGDGGKGIKQDLFGFLDILAMTGGRIVGVQACGSDIAAHKRKIEESEAAYIWLESGGEIELWAWRKVKKKRGGKLMVWSVRKWKYTNSSWEDIR